MGAIISNVKIKELLIAAIVSNRHRTEYFPRHKLFFLN